MLTQSILNDEPFVLERQATYGAKNIIEEEGVFHPHCPTAENVLLVGDFTEWEQNPISLKRLKNGKWKATIPLDPGEHEYRFLVDGQWRDDAECANRKPNTFGAANCVREVK